MLDPKAGSLVFTPANGEAIILKISAMQIFEHAAKANELILSKGVFSGHLMRTEYFDYFALVLFLYQEGQVEFIRVGQQSWRITVPDMLPDNGGSVGALMLIYACCQIALMIEVHPNYYSPELVEKMRMNVDNTYTSESPRFVEAAMKSSAFAFCTLMENVALLRYYSDTSQEDWLTIVDRVCRDLGLPPYSKALEVQLSVAHQTQQSVESQLPDITPEHLTSKEDQLIALLSRRNELSQEQWEILTNFKKLYIQYFFQRSAVATRVLIENPGASATPLLFAENFPSPYVVLETGKGARRIIVRFPWQEGHTYFEIPAFIMSFFQERDASQQNSVR
jgi:hypothetical protein